MRDLRVVFRRCGVIENRAGAHAAPKKPNGDAAESANWFKGGLDSGSLSAVGLRRIVLAATKTALTHEESSAVQSLAALKLWCDEFYSIYRRQYCAESIFPGGELGIRSMRST